MFATKNIICQYVNLTDELNIDLEYDIQTGLLNICVKNTGNTKDYPSQINVLSNEECVSSVFEIYMLMIID